MRGYVHVLDSLALVPILDSLVLFPIPDSLAMSLSMSLFPVLGF